MSAETPILEQEPAIASPREQVDFIRSVIGSGEVSVRPMPPRRIQETMDRFGTEMREWLREGEESDIDRAIHDAITQKAVNFIKVNEKLAANPESPVVSLESMNGERVLFFEAIRDDFVKIIDILTDEGKPPTQDTMNKNPVLFIAPDELSEIIGKYPNLPKGTVRKAVAKSQANISESLAEAGTGIPEPEAKEVSTKATKPSKPKGEVKNLKEELGPYADEIRNHDLLTAEEELELAKRIERGDLDAKDKFVKSNLRLVLKKALPYRGLGLPLADLMQEGVVGLIRGVEKFDRRRGYKFSTYGTWWIRESIQRAVHNTGRLVRYPVPVEQDLHRMQKVSERLEKALGRTPTTMEIADRMGETEETIEWMQLLDLAPASLDKEVVHGDEETALGTLLPDEQAPDPVEIVAEKDEQERLVRSLGELSYEHQYVIAKTYGLAGHEELGIRKIGSELGIGETQVRRMRREALDALRSQMAA